MVPAGAVPAGAVPAGLVIVDKPAGMTSHDVVARLRRLLGTRRIGHAGTLDPMATGVLVCGLQRATRLLGHLPLEPKVYRGTVRLGVATSTDDAQGERLGGVDPSGVGEPEILAGIADLTGAIEQVPSGVSAVKVGGQRAYALARAGEVVRLAARPVTVFRFELLALRSVDGPAIDLDVLVECSGGTYVRALARDLGAVLGVGGHLTALRRTRVGPFGLDGARTLDEIAERPVLTVGLDEAVAAAFPQRMVTAEQARVLAHGGELPATGLAGTSVAFDPAGQAIALLTETGSRARPLLVLRPAGCSCGRCGAQPPKRPHEQP
ncbi:MAG TPA: tRNA pseudouridine(55) synthase TruB [Pseudonocardiaceae bacterium]|nr:tRNA pseudouridine(55) synthase TruB [Pseudonocardiaceae bacterium]